MSLLITASPWNSNDNNTIQSKKKKHTPTMKRSYKYSSEPFQTDDNNTDSMKLSDGIDDPNYIIPTSVDATKVIQEQRNSKINQLLEKMTNVTNENDGSGLGDFNPPPHGLVNSKGLEPVDLLPKTPFVAPPVSNGEPVYRESKFRPMENRFFQRESTDGELNDYRKIYIPTGYSSKYAMPQGGVGGSQNMVANEDDRLMKKIHYMIHLLEEQRNQKTDNVMEEFILYSFLGIFIIYIADSFSRSGKYIR